MTILSKKYLFGAIALAAGLTMTAVTGSAANAAGFALNFGGDGMDFALGGDDGALPFMAEGEHHRRHPSMDRQFDGGDAPFGGMGLVFNIDNGEGDSLPLPKPRLRYRAIADDTKPGNTTGGNQKAPDTKAPDTKAPNAKTPDKGSTPTTNDDPARKKYKDRVAELELIYEVSKEELISQEVKNLTGSDKVEPRSHFACSVLVRLRIDRQELDAERSYIEASTPDKTLRAAFLRDSDQRRQDLTKRIAEWEDRCKAYYRAK